MPKGLSGGTQMPGGFGGINSQVNSAMSSYVNPMVQKITGANNNIPPNIQAYIQSLMSGGGRPQPTQPPQINDINSSDGGGGVKGFWNPNQGMPTPNIENTPSTNSPTSPFAMPQAPTAGTGIASTSEVQNPQGSIFGQQPVSSTPAPAPNMKYAGFSGGAPGANMWKNLPMPGVRGTAITGPPPG